MSLTERTRAFPELWRAENDGDTIEGEIVSVGEKEIDGDTVEYINVLPVPMTKSEVKCVILSNAGLKALNERYQFQRGGYLEIEYKGQSKVIQKKGHYLKEFEGGYIDPEKWLNYKKEGVVDKDGLPVEQKKSKK